MAGNKSTPGSPFYDNIGYYFARHGVLTINATYRLAPKDQWPAGAVDVGAIVRWARENAGHYGADSGRIFLMGHSAGATHSAAYASMKGLQPQEGAGLAGVILVSGIYDPAVEESMPVAFLGGVPGSPNRAYYGADKKLYQERAILSNLTGAPVRTMIVYAESTCSQCRSRPALCIPPFAGGTAGARSFCGCATMTTCPRYSRSTRPMNRWRGRCSISLRAGKICHKRPRHKPGLFSGRKSLPIVFISCISHR